MKKQFLTLILTTISFCIFTAECYAERGKYSCHYLLELHRDTIFNSKTQTNNDGIVVLGEGTSMENQKVLDKEFYIQGINTKNSQIQINENNPLNKTQENVVFDANTFKNTTVEFILNGGTVLKSGIANPAGAVTCWLLDSDIERPRSRSMATAFTEMGAGALRFPYGALSNNYIWTKDPQNISNGLEPWVAVSNRSPGKWDWAVDSLGFFKKDMDFDEYVALCRNIGAEPVVCVNIMSHVYNLSDDITIDTLIYYAKEWVRYANITKDYGIKYWQLGNEQDHHKDIYPLDSFKLDYKKMAEAMHQVDPDIKTAPGLLSKWNNTMLAYCPEYIDFITCHQYLWFGGSDTEGYNAWKDYGASLIPHITKNQGYVDASLKPDLEIFVTETGVTGGTYPDPEVFNLYKGLILFEMQMEQITTPNVKHTFYWGTHTPWNGELGDNPIATLFSNDDVNGNHLQADILTAINTNIQSKLIDKSTVNGIVTYSTLSENDSLMVVFTLNKNTDSQNIKVSTQNMQSLYSYEKWALAGQSEYDAEVEFTLEAEGVLDGNIIETSLPPLSITILRIILNDDAGSTSVRNNIHKSKVKVYPNPAQNMLHIEGTNLFGKDAVMTITNIAGKNCIKQNNYNRSVINISKLKPGVYTLKIADGNNVYSTLFIRK